MSKRLSRIQNTVNLILQNKPYTRNSDDILYLAVIESMSVNVHSHSIADFFLNRSISCLPSFESVSRARRKAQELYPELRAVANVEAARELREEAYREFYSK